MLVSFFFFMFSHHLEINPLIIIIIMTVTLQQWLTKPIKRNYRGFKEASVCSYTQLAKPKKATQNLLNYCNIHHSAGEELMKYVTAMSSLWTKQLWEAT